MTMNDLEKECSAGGVCIFVYVVCVRNVYFKNGVQEWSQDFSARNAKVCAAYAYGLVECAFFIFMVLLYHL